MSFLLKAKRFFKRNVYPITVSLCTVLVLGVITISAYTSIKNNNETINTNQRVDKNDEQTNVGDEMSNQPSSSESTIIFDLPFDKATISKGYTDSSLVYDATTKTWCTHQGIDFSCTEGQEVKAIYDGKITKIENSMMNGTVIYLKVSDTLTVVYKGLASDISVKEGDVVKKGAKLGKSTSFLTEKADGVHLHLELMKDNKLIDPTEYFSFNK